MFEASSAHTSETIVDVRACATCGELPLGGQYARLMGGAFKIYCSPECLAAGLQVRRQKIVAARWKISRRLLLGLVLLGAWLFPREAPWRRRAASPEPAPAPAGETLPPLPSGWFGPEWPPTETSVLAALGRDAWVHPLAGPARRMPRADSRVFGADRPGSRPIECRNGHCGVDLGGEIWGEHIRAAHDGVVDFVQRGLNPDRGGRFVRIAHHDGTIFTQYFHLAAIPRWVERGATVKCGQVIGLLGDTGVKESQPHLHFAVSVRLPDGHERYIDPEPLVALWPLRIPVDGSEVGLVTTTSQPGMPLGSALRHRRAHKAAGKAAAPEAASAPGESAAPPADDGESGGETGGETDGESSGPATGGEE
jgi:murein DD-endopeptidase MepM/ murein hydrolase activator NlpD